MCSARCAIVRYTNESTSSLSVPELALRVEALTKTYGEGDVAAHALRGIDLAVRRGEFVVILGPSGSGKTTLMNIIGGIERPTSGHVRVSSYELEALDARGATAYRRAQVGFVFQFFNLIGTLTALENVQLVAELAGARDAASSEEALRAVGLGALMDRFPGQLSGGEQQRVAIARAVVKRPPLLLADEPTGSLDLETGRVVLSILRGLGDGGERTILVVTHNAAIAQIADRVIRMRSGLIIEDSRVAEPVPAERISW